MDWGGVGRWTGSTMDRGLWVGARALGKCGRARWRSSLGGGVGHGESRRGHGRDAGGAAELVRARVAAGDGQSARVARRRGAPASAGAGKKRERERAKGTYAFIVRRRSSGRGSPWLERRRFGESGGGSTVARILGDFELGLGLSGAIGGG